METRATELHCSFLQLEHKVCICWVYHTYYSQQQAVMSGKRQSHPPPLLTDLIYCWY